MPLITLSDRKENSDSDLASDPRLRTADLVPEENYIRTTLL